ncbi:uncharacterized protein B0I36DRAFT_249156 [Microdochium trichocladiopsis]|uniref:Prolyl 4-hydroxylase alpha subunit domain-containing protein n=1 Tax=Microdochium trichocladiopsis TaxID=1682393 RepID=A0A9P9BLZ9_9PEZI|nr:uncharacterized protein B0I36DRAFT_249156 [Microdochium trichocladiopsis]KAH7025768.1 hypothetical protein B0I36DRAFT_249156 [Microdochium trichocladiopsis]
MSHHQPVQVTYASKQVDIPDGFLVKPAPDSKPITFKQMDWAETVLPEYAGAYAVVLDNVLSPSECKMLLALAEKSVPEEDRVPETLLTSWRPAMVNIGGGYEILEPTYRNSDRIVWDHQELMNRLWDNRLSKGSLLGYPPPTHWDHVQRKYIPDDPATVPRWDFVRMNKRMRFLRYGPGQFFRAHCDGAYTERDAETVDLTTHFTLQLYLNDSHGAALEKGRHTNNSDEAETGGGGGGLVGGATSFLSNDETRKIDVHPRAGRVLIFQHKRLYHAGDDVLQGVKYAMRAELMYRRVVPQESG